MSDEEADDYMSMVIEEPTQKETFTQRKKREQREAEARARVPSKAERAAQEAARRDEALSKSTLDPENKGFQMMAKLGFKPGETLGKKQTPMTTSLAAAAATTTQDAVHPTTPTSAQESIPAARAEPLNLIFKEGRGGIGLDSEKKRKIREQAEEATKKMKTEEGDYRDRVREERETRRTEAQVRAAQKVAERLDAEAENSEGDDQNTRAEDRSTRTAPEGECPYAGSRSSAQENEDSETHTKPPPQQRPYKPTSQINVLYRSLVREREERERSLQARHTLETSLPSSFFPRTKLPGYSDATLDDEDQQALGTRDAYTAIVEQEVEDEDPELEAFNALEPTERLHKLVLYLRDTYRYCFWCKYRYETDEELEGCPGLTEEDHD
ncbi:Uncharacterized protein PECH_003758 [Penicillium ucsense]|uniref:G-patch domain-containing protein n=1 Tax=Penicillium ucsense TaxID=2839758 RepID=A0A8J8WFP6_9EURO|nr:Uncharacterized protein PECM_003165 [Penicillium ucsense]KAF7729183.1 Uncharacterized protein PECH_003758 [Penicillium ucsense]